MAKLAPFDQLQGVDCGIVELCSICMNLDINKAKVTRLAHWEIIIELNNERRKMFRDVRPVVSTSVHGC